LHVISLNVCVVNRKRRSAEYGEIEWRLRGMEKVPGLDDGHGLADVEGQKCTSSFCIYRVGGLLYECYALR
jgi:hypothetical protein